MDGNGSNRARIVAVWMLDGVGVDDEPMKGHPSRIGVLHGEQVAVAQPASGRAGHVRMRWRFDRRQQDSAARASTIKAVQDHAAIIPDRPRAEPESNLPP